MYIYFVQPFTLSYLKNLFQGKKKICNDYKVQTNGFSKSFNLEFFLRERENIKLMENRTYAFYNLVNLVVRVGMKTMYYKTFGRLM